MARSCAPLWSTHRALVPYGQAEVRRVRHVLVLVLRLLADDVVIVVHVHQPLPPGARRDARALRGCAQRLSLALRLAPGALLGKGACSGRCLRQLLPHVIPAQLARRPCVWHRGYGGVAPQGAAHNQESSRPASP